MFISILILIFKFILIPFLCLSHSHPDSSASSFLLFQVALVITDGQQTTTKQYTPLDEASRGLKDKGVIVYALGVSKGASLEELNKIASSPDTVVVAPTFKALGNVAATIRKRLCESKRRTPCSIYFMTPS